MSSQEVLNETLDFISSSDFLSDWQKTQLYEINTESGVQCLLRMWLNYSYDELSQGSYCNATWDNVYCWPPIPSGTVITRLCSETFREMDPYYAAHMEGNARRVCLNNGTWQDGRKSDFTECAESFQSYLKTVEEDKYLVPMVQYMLFFGSIFSLLFLGVALVVFLHFRCLWCERVTVQIHLMLALVFRFALLFVIAEPFVLGRVDNYRNVDILCESILVVFLYATVASIKWMFIQGLYLNLSLYPRFSNNNQSRLKIYYIIGWVVPAGIVLGYVIAMLLRENHGKCWHGYLDMNEMWILLGPIIFALSVNGLFLINILRVLMKKVRNSNSRSDTSQVKAAAKATALLFPVLGINNLILLYNPGGDYNKYFVILNTFFGSTQGIFVAIVYCFNNKEVKGAIRRSWNRIQARREAQIDQIRNSEQNSSLNGFSLVTRFTDMLRSRTEPQDCACEEQAV